MPAPTLVSYVETVWNTTGAAKSLPTTSWLTGDLIVVGVLTEDGICVGAVANQFGLTFTSTTVGTSGSTCFTGLWRATASNDQTSVAVAATSNDGGGNTHHWGLALWVFRNHGGAGTPATDITTAKTVSLTRAVAQSRVITLQGDYSAASTAGYSFTPTLGTGNDREHLQDVTRYTIYVADWDDQGAAGSTSYGTTGETSTGTFAKIAIEVKGLAGGEAFVPHRSQRPGPRTRFRQYQPTRHDLFEAEAAGVAVGQIADDSIGLTDSVAFEQQLVRTDSAGLTDTTAFTEALIRTDDAGLTDSATQALVKTVDQTDSVGLTDSVALTESLVRTDSAGLTDAVLIQQQLVRTDDSGLTDSSTIQVVKAVTVDDPAGLTDTTAFSEQLVRTDLAGLTDTAELTEQLVRTDSAGLTDSATVQSARLVIQDDTAGLTDTATLVTTYIRTVTDDTGLSDAVDIGGVIIPKAALIEPGTRVYAAIEPATRAGAAVEPGTRGAAVIAGASKTSAQVSPGTRSGPNVEGGA